MQSELPADDEQTHSPKQVEVKCLAQGHLHYGTRKQGGMCSQILSSSYFAVIKSLYPKLTVLESC